MTGLCRWAFALLLWAAGASVAHAAPAATTVAARAQEVDRLLGEWRIEEAAALTHRLGAIAPGHPRVLAASGAVLFHQGQYDAALALLRAAERGQRGLAARFRPLTELVRSTAEAVKGFVEKKSPSGHFRIRTARGKDELLVPFAIETLEAIREALAKDLGYAPPGTVLVEIYPRAEELARVSTLTQKEIERSGTVALCKYDRLMAVSPRALLRGYPWRDTLAHEYVHLVVSRASRNTVPIWLHEGLAKLFEVRWRLGPEEEVPLGPTQEHLLAEALAARRLVGWSEMHPSMAKLPDQRSTALAFAQVHTALAYLKERAGLPGLRRLLGALRAGRDDWLAVHQVATLPPGGFERAWRKYLRGLKLRRLPGLVPAELTFGTPRTKEQELAALREQRAKRHFRLADLLRQRKLLPAAILEYERARDAAGERDAFVSNALARSFLEVDQPARAIAALSPVLEYYPDLSGPQVTMGAAYLRRGDPRAATRHLKVALRLNPFDPEVHCGLSRALPAGPEAERHGRLCSTLVE
ncbi:MAG: hypothetical protein IT371_13370 [Deltaproteobacteria bacterium]|nr:hypothetical protein [Deltaproteobacteria bacterium]